ncbi:MAG: ABC transporter substrate-binding protein [Rhodovulum sulfidophilum]|uniref:ABC transporter substrate-binding protein n=1 Tax=Rhodovulum sulfidophilum TaxID=35806 RepID=A0A2W5NBL8_RHOSU|nr:MAG: ABC transporter substrate-binding protein [Rhodovulum sulfidophilum]
MEVIHSLFYSPLYIAKGQGYFAEEGIDFDLIAAQGSDKATAAILGGSADIALVGPETTVYVRTGKSPLKIRMFAGLTATDGSFLMAHEPIEDFDWSQVKGKTILSWREGSAPALFLRAALRENGIDPETDVEIVSNVAPAARAGAFMAGTADFGTFFEPDVSVMRATEGAEPLANIGSAVGAIDYTVFVASEDYIAENPAIVQGFTDAIAKAQDWIATAPAGEAARVLAPFFPGVDAGVLEASFERQRAAGVWKATPAIAPEAISALQDMLVAGGLMTEDQRQPFEALVAPEFAAGASGL